MKVNGYGHQIPPEGDDWLSWTIVGSRKTGKTWAGIRWMQSKLTDLSRCSRILFLGPTTSHNSHTMKQMYEHLNNLLQPGLITFTRKGEEFGQFVFNPTGSVLQARLYADNTKHNLYGVHYDFVWADEILNAQMIVDALPATEKFLFTEPTILPVDTVVSRAGDRAPTFH